jgi:capsule biosynthesis phosphatase
MKRIICDLDDTIAFTEMGDYLNAKPNLKLIERLRDYQKKGFEVVIHTSRNVRTYNGNVGKINVHTLPIILDWLKRLNVPYDEIVVGKPWCGTEGFYIDDKSIRPDEFTNLSDIEIEELLSSQKLKSST